MLIARWFFVHTRPQERRVEMRRRDFVEQTSQTPRRPTSHRGCARDALRAFMVCTRSPRDPHHRPVLVGSRGAPARPSLFCVLVSGGRSSLLAFYSQWMGQRRGGRWQASPHHRFGRPCGVPPPSRAFVQCGGASVVLQLRLFLSARFLAKTRSSQDAVRMRWAEQKNEWHVRGAEGRGRRGGATGRHTQ